MKNYYLKLVCSLFMTFSFVIISNAQDKNNFWSNINSNDIKNENISFYKAKPKKSTLININIDALRNQLIGVPQRHLANKNQGIVISLPNYLGKPESYLIQEASVMEPELQSQFPNIRSYVGKGIDNPAAILRFSLSPQKGFSGMILSDGKTVFIEPYSNDLKTYIAFVNSEEDGPRENFICETDYSPSEFKISDEEYIALRNANDGTLRTYRLALACTVEYAQFHGGTMGGVMAAMNTTMNRVNGVYERDLGLTMVIVGNNQNVIFLGPNVESDPYTNGSGFAMLGENQATCDSNIGTGNYDIGHVFSTGGGGVAALNSPCNPNTKAQGVTGSNVPQGDPFDIDFVAHEMGHQFGGNHTQNNNCQRSSVSVEPGSASTIMGYAGICAPNIQNNSDDYFHGENIKEMWANIFTGTSSTCFSGTPTNNVAPVVNAGANFSIPKSTPFVLKGSANDVDTQTGLLYCWEQTDTTPATMPPQSTNTAGPAFRSLDPSTSPDRFMPPLGSVMLGITPTWEVLPSVARTMNFSLTVRDNDIAGGATGSDAMVVSVEDVTPFTVNTPPTWGQGSSQEVTWIVGQTDVAPINSQNVNILFTTNNGSSFTTLASNVPNTGSATITVPNIGNTNNAKVLVESADNIFYAVSDAFSISPTPDFAINSTSGDTEVCSFESSVDLTFDYVTSNGFSETTVFSVSGLPGSTNPTISPASLNASGTVTLTIDDFDTIADNDYTITFTGTSPSLTRSTSLVLTKTGSVCPQTCDTFASPNNLGIGIPDGTGGNQPGASITHTINIPANENVNILDLKVNVNISHTYIQDLVITVEHPSSTPGNPITATLWQRECTGENNMNITFETGAAAINCAQTTGTYEPSGDLTVFNGLDSTGDWTITVTDFFNQDTGQLNNWSLEVCSANLSVEENDIENLSIYPNPNDGEFTIGFNPKSGDDINIEIYDIRGRSIYTKKFNTVSRFEEVIRLNDAQSGVYLLRILDGPQSITKRIIID